MKYFKNREILLLLIFFFQTTRQVDLHRESPEPKVRECSPLSQYRNSLQCIWVNFKKEKFVAL